MVGVTESRGPKSDKRDAYGLAERLRVGGIDKRIFKAPRQFTRLRELSRIHMTLVGDVIRVQSRIKSLYRSRGVMVCGLNDAALLVLRDGRGPGALHFVEPGYAVLSHAREEDPDRVFAGAAGDGAEQDIHAGSVVVHEGSL